MVSPHFAKIPIFTLFTKNKKVCTMSLFVACNFPAPDFIVKCVFLLQKIKYCLLYDDILFVILQKIKYCLIFPVYFIIRWVLLYDDYSV